MDLSKIFDTSTKRKLILLDQINAVKGTIKIQSLMDSEHWERRTIQKYIDSLVKDCSDYGQENIVFIKREHSVEMVCNDDGAYQSFVLYIIENSLPIILLQNLLLGEKIVFQRFITKYFISDSTFSRRLRAINVMLLPYSLKLIREKGILKIKGEEKQIRMFAYTFFWEMYRGRKWPFAVVEEQKIIHLVDYMGGFSALWNHSDMHQIRYILAVNLIRFRRGFAISFTKNQLHSYFSEEFLKQPREWLRQFSYPDSELLFFFMVSQTKEQFFLFSDFGKQILDFHRNKQTEVFKATEYFFDCFSRMIFQVSDKDKQKYYAFIFTNHLFCSIFYYFPEDMSGIFSEQSFSRQFPTLFKRLGGLLDIMVEETKYSLFGNRNFLLTRYALLFSMITDINFFETPIVVCFDTDLPELLEDRAIQIFYSYFHFFFNVSIVRQSTLLSKQKIDLLITTNFIQDPNIPHTVYIMEGLRAEKISEIELVLERIKIQKYLMLGI